MSLKDSWKDTGIGLGNAFRDLGKTLIKTAKTGADKLDEWANSDDEKPKTASNEEKPKEDPSAEKPKAGSDEDHAAE